LDRQNSKSSKKEADEVLRLPAQQPAQDLLGIGHWLQKGKRNMKNSGEKALRNDEAKSSQSNLSN
jgi:hypothetical protein